ncbi:hypothetical protein JCM3765_002491 [Sporobolomyces pararoseus]
MYGPGRRRAVDPRDKQTRARQTDTILARHLAPSVQFVQSLRRRSPSRTPPLPYFSPFENEADFLQPNVDLAFSPHPSQPASSQHSFHRSGAPSPRPVPPHSPTSRHPSPNLDLNLAPSSSRDLVRLSLALPTHVNSSNLTSYFKVHLNVQISNVSLLLTTDRKRFHGSFDTERKLWENGDLLGRIQRAEQQGYIFNIQSGRGWRLRPHLANSNNSRQEEYRSIQKQHQRGDHWIRLKLSGFSIEMRKTGVEEILVRLIKHWKDLQLYSTSRRIVRIAEEEEEVEEIVVVKVSVGGEEAAQLLESEFGKYAYGGTIIEVSREKDLGTRRDKGLLGIGDGLIIQKEKKKVNYSKEREMANEDRGGSRRGKSGRPDVSNGKGRWKDGSRFYGRYFTWPKSHPISSSSGDEESDSDGSDSLGSTRPQEDDVVDEGDERRRTRQSCRSRSRSRSPIRRSLSPRSRLRSDSSRPLSRSRSESPSEWCF